jgi:hypothetical protein
MHDGGKHARRRAGVLGWFAGSGDAALTAVSLSGLQLLLVQLVTPFYLFYVRHLTSTPFPLPVRPSNVEGRILSSQYRPLVHHPRLLHGLPHPHAPHRSLPPQGEQAARRPPGVGDGQLDRRGPGGRVGRLEED